MNLIINIKKVSLEVLSEHIALKEPLGYFYSQEGENYIAMKNKEGAPEVENFDNEENMKQWFQCNGSCEVCTCNKK